MPHLLPYANVVAGIVVLVFDFALHWLGQTLSILNGGLATRFALREPGMPPEYKVYAHAVGVADACIG